MQPGSVIVDLAAERGGNCELTKPGETVVEHGVTILGPVNLPATVPFHASQMFAKNIVTFLLNMVKEGKLELEHGRRGHRGVDGHPRRRGRQRAGPRGDGAGPGGRRTPIVTARGKEGRMEMFVLILTIFVLAIFVGFEVITKVPPTLHTPLMSGSNAISGITIIGALLLAGQLDNPQLAKIMAAVARGLRHDQRGRRLPGHPPHARHVPEEEVEDRR